MNFGKRFGLILASAAFATVCFTAAQVSAAGVVVGSKVAITNPGGALYGTNGEFNVYVQGSGTALNAATPDFWTFCIQKDETFNPNAGYAYDVVGLTTSTQATVYSLTKEVAYLFREFTRVKNSLPGAIAGFYGPLATEANKLQEAIWHYSTPSQQSFDNNNRYMIGSSNSIWTSQMIADKNALVDFGGVRVMTIKSGGTWVNGVYVGGTHHQDQLYVELGDLSTEVPEPASVAMWLTVAAGGAFARRRRAMVC